MPIEYNYHYIRPIKRYRTEIELLRDSILQLYERIQVKSSGMARPEWKAKWMGLRWPGCSKDRWLDYLTLGVSLLATVTGLT